MNWTLLEAFFISLAMDIIIEVIKYFFDKSKCKLNISLNTSSVEIV